MPLITVRKDLYITRQQLVIIIYKHKAS